MCSEFSVDIRFHTEKFKTFYHHRCFCYCDLFISYSKLYVCGRQEICFFSPIQFHIFAEYNTSYARFNNNKTKYRNLIEKKG